MPQRRVNITKLKNYYGKYCKEFERCGVRALITHDDGIFFEDGTRYTKDEVEFLKRDGQSIEAALIHAKALFGNDIKIMD